MSASFFSFSRVSITLVSSKASSHVACSLTLFPAREKASFPCQSGRRIQIVYPIFPLPQPSELVLSSISHHPESINPFFKSNIVCIFFAPFFLFLHIQYAGFFAAKKSTTQKTWCKYQTEIENSGSADCYSVESASHTFCLISFPHPTKWNMAAIPFFGCRKVSRQSSVSLIVFKSCFCPSVISSYFSVI